MLKRSDFIAEQKKGLSVRKLIASHFLIRAFAEGEDHEDEPAGAPAPVNFEVAIAQARKEEKDKLYLKIKNLQEENKSLSTSVNKYVLENAALKEDIEKQKAAGVDVVKYKQLEERVKTLEEENTSLKENTPKEEEIRNQIAAEYEVKMHIQQVIAENKDSVLGILVPSITGKTKEEVDAALESAKKQTLDTRKELGLVDDEGKPTKPGKKKTEEHQEKPPRVPAANPAVDSFKEEEFDADYVRNLDPRSPEYAEFRKKMGLR